MDKDAYYFSHDSNARQDEKTLKLRMKFGWEGYGLYWAIIEKLRDASNYELKLDFNLLAFDLRTDNEKIKSIVTGFGLFSIDQESKVFFSKSLKDRMLIRESKSKKASESAKKRWSKTKEECEVNANVMRTHSDSNARKGKERKVNINICDFSESDFLSLWTKARMHYDKKPTKISKLNFNEKELFKELLKTYKEEDFRNAINGVFFQDTLPAVRVRPKWMLELDRFESMMDCWINKSKIFDSKNDKKQTKL